MFSPDVIAAVAVAFVLAGFVKGVVGLGLPIISISILAATIGLKTAIGLFLIPSLVTNVWQAFSGGHFRILLRRLWPLFAMASVGIWFGVRILAVADNATLVVALGGVLVVYAVIGLTRAEMPKPGRWEPWLTPVMGMAGGVMFGMMGNFMVPGVLYVQSLGFTRDMFVQALGITFLVITVVLLLTLTRQAMMPLETAILSAGALVPTAIGMYLGQRYRKMLSEAQFRTRVFIAIGCAGVYMIGRTALTAQLG